MTFLSYLPLLRPYHISIVTSGPAPPKPVRPATVIGEERGDWKTPSTPVSRGVWGFAQAGYDLAMGPAPNSLADGKTVPDPVPARLVQPAGPYRAGVPNI